MHTGARRIRLFLAVTTALMLALSMMALMAGSAQATTGERKSDESTSSHYDWFPNKNSKCDKDGYHDQTKPGDEDHGGTTTTTMGTTTTTMGTTTTTMGTTTTTMGQTVGPVDVSEPDVEDEVSPTEITNTTANSATSDSVSDLEVLPFTGSDSSGLLMVAGSLLVLGLALVASARPEEEQ